LRPAPFSYVGTRNTSTSSQKDLKESLKDVIPAKRKQLEKLKAEHGQKVLCEVKVENAIGGMRYVSIPDRRRLQWHLTVAAD
jgi:citrate synthase